MLLGSDFELFQLVNLPMKFQMNQLLQKDKESIKFSAVLTLNRFSVNIEFSTWQFERFFLHKNSSAEMMFTLAFLGSRKPQKLS